MDQPEPALQSERAATVDGNGAAAAASAAASATETAASETLSLRRQFALMLFVFVLALLPRILSPSPFVTWDEPTWTYRSGVFAEGLRLGDYADTHQSNHPGVPTMWVAAAEMWPAATMNRLALYHWLDPQEMPAYDEDDTDLLFLLAQWWPMARAGIAYLTAGLIAATFFLLMRLLNTRSALVAASLLTFSPYFLAHSRVLQLDAVLAISMVASVVALTVFLRRGTVRYAAMAGALAGFAALEKSPALFLVPFALLVVVTYAGAAWRRSGAGLSLWRVALASAVWFGALAATYYALWPALWEAPLETLAEMFEYATRSASGAREAVYFWGTVQPDPGVLFYLGSLPHRVMPLTLIGLVAAPLLVRRGTRDERVLVVVLVSFVVLFTLFMGNNAKKFERYILPVVPALVIVAGIGLTRLSDWVSRRLARWAAHNNRHLGAAVTNRAGIVGLIVLIALQAGAVFAHHPYYLAWYNPLLGGGSAAAERLPVGWGEGMDLAATYLHDRVLEQGAARGLNLSFAEELCDGVPRGRLPDIDTTVATPSVTLLAPIFCGTTVKARHWQNADYVVLYVDDVQIGEPDIVRQFHGVVEPEHVVTINGIDYAWIYRVESATP